MTFRYTEPNGNGLTVSPGIVDTNTGQPLLCIDALTLTVQRRYDGTTATIYIPLDKVEEVIAGIRDTARQASQ